MKTKLLIGLTIIAMILVGAMYTSAATAGMQPGAAIVPTWTPPAPNEDPGVYPYPLPPADPYPYPVPEQELIMKSEQWIETDGLIQIFAAP